MLHAHPLRPIRQFVDAALEALSPDERRAEQNSSVS